MKNALRLFLLYPFSAVAEVMDKEASLEQLFVWGAVSSALSFIAARYRPKWIVAVAFVPAMFVWSQLSEITDPFVGPDIIREAGPFYVQVSWALPWPMLIALILGLALRRFAAQPKNPADAFRRR
jgi:hypothetical protein